ncbi:MAG: hypothetical protein A3I75_01140 [Deltaproteobacteria bacterium RIFCSPLOWO2_02_FULL_50_16]|nr:MAG: hypothetical protein A2053_06535 [Deltaproteobacteria bacterium GWA2_50_8]OGQ26012.1 MAG: hypothetical protein A3B79_03310 [Deltaproteobacteria bacterium RIFCSPHIGHO2_02_FULL_50_15]OGQ58369.1 MAG: hypothetical protein A3I75_01140 [Deltaproteobacteria bacterium RIFCSPLOWO2_02_FULL_50_16]OGQ68511.1 MAG: hypothetical protein A3F89_00360 [Deltaproteobacteria bacterium RIFCSPLOWO2_12_FULL_50_11]
MKEDIKKLYDLSLIDIVIQEKQEILEQIPKRLKSIEAEWSLAQENWEAKKVLLDTAEKERREKETSLQDNEERIKQRESRLYEIKTNKEYQAAIHEMTESKKTNKTLEEEVIKKLEEIETLSKVVDELKQKAEVRGEEFKKAQIELGEEKKSLQVFIKEEQTRRIEIEKAVKADLLKKYNRVLHVRKVAIAHISSGICQSCYMHIPPQIYNQILKGNDILLCPNCNRILFVESQKNSESKEPDLTTSEGN